MLFDLLAILGFIITIVGGLYLFVTIWFWLSQKGWID